MKAEKWLFECRNLEEKCDLVTKEKEVKLHVLEPRLHPACPGIAHFPGGPTGILILPL